MSEVKVLLTSGCSFTETEEGHTRCWPLPLSEILQIPLVNYGKSSVGNQYIARTIILGVEKLLQEYTAKDILVGVMWSGTDRHEVYQNEWKIMNAHWEDNLSTAYYTNLHDLTGAALMSTYWQFLIEHYLQNKGIKYFMTRIASRCSELILEESDNNEYKSLQANRKNWLPVKGQFDWLKTDCRLPFTKLEKEGIDSENQDWLCHPDDAQHKEFTKQVILPWLKETYKI